MVACRALRASLSPEGFPGQADSADMVSAGPGADMLGSAGVLWCAVLWCAMVCYGVLWCAMVETIS